MTNMTDKIIEEKAARLAEDIAEIEDKTKDLKKSLKWYLKLLVFLVINALVITLCWNITMPYLFELKELSIHKSFCLYLLVRCLVNISITKAVPKTNK